MRDLLSVISRKTLNCQISFPLCFILRLGWRYISLAIWLYASAMADCLFDLPNEIILLENIYRTASTSTAVNL